MALSGFGNEISTHILDLCTHTSDRQHGPLVSFLAAGTESRYTQGVYCTIPLFVILGLGSDLPRFFRLRKLTSITAGLFSSFLSHAVRVRFYYPRIISQLSSAGPATTATTTGAALASAGAQAAATSPTIVPSLGASGAIWACVSLTALAFPDAQMALFIPTSFSIPIQTGTLGMVALDVIGIFRGWRYVFALHLILPELIPNP